MRKKIKTKKVWKIIIPAAAAVVVILLAAVSRLGSAQEAMTEAMAVEALTVETGDVSETVETNGTVVSGEKKTLFSPVNAQVEIADFQTGDLVKAGDKLVSFNLKDLEEQNQKAELTVKANQLGYQDSVNKSNEAAARQAEAKSQAASLQTQVDAKKQEVANLTVALSGEAQSRQEARQQEIDDINGQIQSLQQQLEEALKALEKAKTAYDKAVTAQQTAQVNFDAAAAAGEEQALEKAREALNKANKKLSEAKSDYETKQQAADELNSQIASLQASLEESAAGTDEKLQQQMETAQAELSELEAKLESQKAVAETDSGALSSEARAQMQTNNNLAELESKSLEELIAEGRKGITAEFDGVISDKQVVEGAAVSQGMELLTLQSIDNVNVEVTLSKNVYEKVKKGQKAEITFAGQTYQGTVTKISRIAVGGAVGSNQASSAAASIMATVHIDDPDDNIFLGVDAKVTILAAQAKDVVILPTEAVNIGKDGTFCWVCEDGVLTKRSIATGVSSDECLEITEGVKAGEQVIADPGSHEEGDSVIVMEQSQE